MNSLMFKLVLEKAEEPEIKLPTSAGSSKKQKKVNQIPYDYTVEVTKRFKGLDLIECLKNYGWRFMPLYRRQ